MPEFDPHAAIKTLAKREWPCPALVWHKSKEAVENASKCPGGCGGTGRIVPFKELRATCIVGEHHDARGEAWHGHYPDVHRDAECPGWRPEPDVEKACWRILEEHPDILTEMVLSSTRMTKERVLRAALAWAQEQQKETQRG